VAVAFVPSPVASARFTCDGKFVVTSGLRDRALHVWRVHHPDDAHRLPAGAATVVDPRAAAAGPTTGGGGSLEAAGAVVKVDGGSGGGLLGSAATLAELLVGCVVQVHGLSKRCDLNGLRGVVVAYQGHPAARFTLRLQLPTESCRTSSGQGEPKLADVSIKPAHVRRLPVSAWNDDPAFVGSP
jgi:hypothetical protein